MVACLTVEEYYHYVGKSTETNARLLAEKIGKKDRAEEIHKDKLTHFHELQAQGLPPIEGTVDFIHRLAKDKEKLGLKLGIASALGKQEILSHLRNLGIESYFDVILSGTEDLGDYRDREGVNKPKPYIYLHAAKLLHVAPSQCVVIEDSSTGIAAGVDAGCITVAVANSYSHQQDLSRAHIKIASFANISIEEFLQAITDLESA